MLNLHLSIVQQIAILAIQLGIIVFAAKFCGDFAAKCKMPSVLGELLAGIIIGPYVLGGIPIPLHGMEHGLFGFQTSYLLTLPGSETGIQMANVTFSMYHSSLYAIATVGSVLLLFLSGLETDLRMFIRYSIVGTIVGIGGVVFSYFFGAAVGLLLFKNVTIMDPRCMFLGILCTATSVGITARILSEKKKIDTPEGVTILAAAVIDDVLGIICLAIVLGIVSSMSKGVALDVKGILKIAAQCMGIWIGATAIGLLLSRYIAKFLHLFKSPVVFANLSLGLALLLAGLFEQAGLAMIIGAYVMGLSLSKTDVSFAIMKSLHPLYAFLVPVFFVVMGMLVDVRVFADPEVLKIGLIYSLLAVLAKILGCAIPSMFMNFNIMGALRIGVGMIPRGEVALIIAGIGAGILMEVNGEMVPILDSKLFGLAIIMTLATTVVAPPLLSLVLGLGGKGVRKETKNAAIVHTPFKFPTEAIADYVMQRMIETFEKEGYMLSRVDKDNGMVQIRKDNIAFAMVRTDNEFVFETTQNEVVFVNTVMYEIIVDLHQSLSQLKEMAKPEEVQKNLIAAPANNELAPKAMLSVVERAIHEDCVIMDLKSNTKEEVFREMLEVMAARKHSPITDMEMCYQNLIEREKIVTTCMQNGVGIPHARTDGVSDMIAAIGIRKSGYQFDSMDGRPTKLFIMCVSPKNSNGPHIEFVASIAQKVAKPEQMDKILALQTPSEIISYFTAKTLKS